MTFLPSKDQIVPMLVVALVAIAIANKVAFVKSIVG